MTLAAGTAEKAVRAGFAHHRAGEFDQAESLYRAALAVDDEDVDALHLLGAVSLVTGRAAEALPLLSRAAEIAMAAGRVNPSKILNNLGNALSALGRHDEAIIQYQMSLRHAPHNAEALANFAGELLALGHKAEAAKAYNSAVIEDGRAEWHHKLGQVHLDRARIDEADASFREALQSNPDYVPALFDLGQICLRRWDSTQAVVLFERVRTLDHSHVEVHRALGLAYRRLGHSGHAVIAFERYNAAAPDSVVALLYLGATLSEVGRAQEAMVYLKKALQLEDSNPHAHIELANAFLRTFKPQEARDHFLRATQLQPYITRKGTQKRFSILFVLAPGVANTPYDYLVGRADYDAHFLWWIPEASYDVAHLRESCDAVFSLISDADQAPATLAAIGRFVDHLGKSVINHPRKVLMTARACIASMLSDIPNCRAARVSYVERTHVFEAANKYAAPFLIRVAGLHGGLAFEKINSADEALAFTMRCPGLSYHLLDYLDYRSTDGFYRKYRFYFIGEDVLPYHLAIGDQWKVHHCRTDMAERPWMMSEEAAFLQNPTAVFGPKQMEVLRTVAKRIGLDFMGVDCGLDADGNVVVFEANAAMLVHGNNGAFPYKDKPVRRIKGAFDSMLARVAGDNRP